MLPFSRISRAETKKTCSSNFGHAVEVARYMGFFARGEEEKTALIFELLGSMFKLCQTGGALVSAAWESTPDSWS